MPPVTNDWRPPPRVETAGVEDLGPQVVAEPGDETLVEEKRCQLAAAEALVAQARDQGALVEVRVEDVGAETGEKGVLGEALGVEHGDVRGADFWRLWIARRSWRRVFASWPAGLTNHLP